mgnify:CR=1 FL=1|tara:strand:- start:266 stop:496 length:231 start_codon:yes stop_codon:yes gene_type:complete
MCDFCKGTHSHDNQPAVDMLLRLDRSIVHVSTQDLGVLVDSFGGDSRAMFHGNYGKWKHDMLVFLFDVLNDLKRES